TEVNDLRRRLHAAEKLNDAQDQRIHVLETNGTIRMLATERMATILGLVRDAVNKGVEEFSAAELDAMERDRELPELPAREEEADEVVIDGVNVRRIDRAEILRRLEQNMAEDDGAPIP